MEKELLENFHFAKKAAESGNEERCVEALSGLKGFPVTVDLLKSTNVAKGIRNSLAIRNCSKKIQILARQVISTWRKTILARNQTKLRKPAGGDLQKKIPTAVDSVTRNRIRQQVSEALCLVFNESHGDIVIRDPVEIAVAVESALFAEWGSTLNNSKYRSFLFNLRDPKNPDFRRKIATGVIKPEGVAKLSLVDMASDERKLENEKIAERSARKRLIERKEEDEKGTTKEFQCRRCGKRETTYYQLQTRSADEPMTAYVTCKNCDNRWKFC